MAFSSRRDAYRGLTGGYSMNPGQMDDANSEYVGGASDVLQGIIDFETEINNAAANIEGESYDQMKKTTSEFKTLIENFNAFAREMARVVDERKTAALNHDSKYANLMDISNISKS